jgi:hypothetical protein
MAGRRLGQRFPNVTGGNKFALGIGNPIRRFSRPPPLTTDNGTTWWLPELVSRSDESLCVDGVLQATGTGPTAAGTDSLPAHRQHQTGVARILAATIGGV